MNHLLLRVEGIADTFWVRYTGISPREAPFFRAIVYRPGVRDILSGEDDILNFRYFDAAGNQLTSEQLKSMCITTPAMEHILATVKERIEKSWKSAERLEDCTHKRYN